MCVCECVSALPAGRADDDQVVCLGWVDGLRGLLECPKVIQTAAPHLPYSLRYYMRAGWRFDQVGGR